MYICEITNLFSVVNRYGKKKKKKSVWLKKQTNNKRRPDSKMMCLASFPGDHGDNWT